MLNQNNQDETDKPKWQEDAEKRLGNVPRFVRGIVRKTVEKYAKKQGYTTIDTTVWEEAKAARGKGF